MTSLPKLISWDALSEPERAACSSRPVQARADAIRQSVAEIVARVRGDGDAAVRELTERFDKVKLGELEVSAKRRSSARSKVSQKAMHAIERAMENIESFHRAQLQPPLEHQPAPGITCMQRSQPIDRVGLYVPGGSAPLISTALMLAVPARVAGCPLRILCTPPNSQGRVDPHILLVAEMTQVHRVFKVGGAQAIAAMAFGTESIPKVDKVFGPGNAYVTEAKVQCAHSPEGAALDLPAGPSEVLVIADKSARPEFVAADLLSQAEHDKQSQVLLIATSQKIGRQVIAALDDQLARAPRRDIAAKSLAHARMILASDIEQAIAISNRYAPEHLILQIERPHDWLDAITCAGSVFIGPFTPEAVGDYASGTNHVLPTYGHARSYSGLSASAFSKTITFQELSREGLRALGPTVEILAELEGLDAHKQAVRLRLDALASEPGEPGEPESSRPNAGKSRGRR